MFDNADLVPCSSQIWTYHISDHLSCSAPKDARGEDGMRYEGHINITSQDDQHVWFHFICKIIWGWGGYNRNQLLILRWVFNFTSPDFSLYSGSQVATKVIKLNQQKNNPKFLFFRYDFWIFLDISGYVDEQIPSQDLPEPEMLFCFPGALPPETLGAGGAVRVVACFYHAFTAWGVAMGSLESDKECSNFGTCKLCKFADRYFLGVNFWDKENALLLKGFVWNFLRPTIQWL